MSQAAEGPRAALARSKGDFTALELGPIEQTAAPCAGKADAIISFVGHPNGLIQDVTSRCRARLVPVEGPAVDALPIAAPYLQRLSVPAGTYANNGADTPTFGARALLLTRADVPDAEVADGSG